MALDKTKLAKAINKAINATDAEGKPLKVTPEMEVYADAVISALKASKFNHTLVEGLTTAGSPLTLGKAENGLFLPPVPTPIWLAKLQAGFPTASPADLAKEAACSTLYITTSAKINFKPESISGDCTSTASNPGPLLNGAGKDGTVDGLKGKDWASKCIPPTGDKDLATKIYDSIATYIKENAEASYLANSVTGTCPVSAGPLSLGVGLGGTIK